LRDPSGTQAFELNRKLGAKVGEKNIVRANCNCLSHTFVYTADSFTVNGKTYWLLIHTYSWGNAAGSTTWHMDQPEDITAALQAIYSNYMGWQFGGTDSPDYDQAVDQAYANLSTNPYQTHSNWGIAANCKNAVGDLEDEAQRIWKFKMKR